MKEFSTIEELQNCRNTQKESIMKGFIDNDIQKGRISNLTPKIIIDKNGYKRKVWVKVSDKPKSKTHQLFEVGGKEYMVHRVLDGTIDAIRTSDRQRIQFSKKILAKKGIKFESDHMDDSTYQRKQQIKEEERRAAAAEREANKTITTKQYHSYLKSVMEDAASDGNEEYTYDLAGNLQYDEEIAKYAKKKYGNQWKLNLQWDLESYL